MKREGNPEARAASQQDRQSLLVMTGVRVERDRDSCGTARCAGRYEHPVTRAASASAVDRRCWC